MASGLNKVCLIGNLGKDPEFRYTPSGAAVCSFSVAVSRAWTDHDGNKRDETEWFNVVAWDKLADLINQFLRKGRKVYIEGRLQTRSWDGQDGQKKYRTEVVAQQMLMLDKAPADDGGRDEGPAPVADAGDWDADLPF